MKLKNISKSGAQYPDHILRRAFQQIQNILLEDLPQIIEHMDLPPLTVCAVPRAKAYTDMEMLWFTVAVDFVANELSDQFRNGTGFIKRIENTRTTHLDKFGGGGDGKMPYPGITKDTCRISPEVAGKDILLIDDLYTETVNVDEDAIQALFDNGAKSVIFYSIGKTIFRNS